MFAATKTIILIEAKLEQCLHCHNERLFQIVNDRHFSTNSTCTRNIRINTSQKELLN